MTNRKKEFAKFFTGVAAEETMIHWALGLNGVLPLEFWGLTLTPTVNSALMIFWPILTVALFYYAWVRK